MKLTLGQLRRLVSEQITVQADPFKPDLRALARQVLGVEESLGNMPQVIGEMEAMASSLKTKGLLKKAAGLAYHARNDLRALEALLTIAAKQLKKQ